MSTFWRLTGFLRPYRRAVNWSFVLAGGALIGTVLIPYLTGVAINAIRASITSGCCCWRGAILLAGLVRLVFSVLRRLSPAGSRWRRGRPARDAVRPVAAARARFFDRQQTGQLMSRATVDLQSVRFFLGYGLIFIGQSVVTILLAAIAMFILQPSLAAISLAPVPFVVLIAYRYGHRSQPGDAGGPAADRRADRRHRGERLGRPRRQGVRAGAPPTRAVRAHGPSACSTSSWSRPGSRPSTTR